MFPARLPALPDLLHHNSPHIQDFISIGGGGGGDPFGGIFSGGGPSIGMPPIGGTGNPGNLPKTTPVSISGGLSAAIPGLGGLSSVLGIPSINWGRLAAFLLGLLLIAGGLYLLRPVQQIVNATVKDTIKGAAVA